MCAVAHGGERGELRPARPAQSRVMARRTWTDAAVEAEILLITRELGRFPRRADLAERGVGGLWEAMRRRGGIDAWRERAAPLGDAGPGAGLAAAEAAPAPLREDVERAAYFLYENGHPGDAVTHWLTAERLLHAA